MSQQPVRGDIIPGLSFDLFMDALDGRRVESRNARPERQTTLVDESGKPSSWLAIRAHVLRRDNWTCQGCGAEADEIDHIFPRRWGGSDFLENLRAICGTCNKVKGASADLQIATLTDLGGGLDVALTRILSEVNTYIVPIINELDARIRRQECTDSQTVVAGELIDAAVSELRAISMHFAGFAQTREASR